MSNSFRDVVARRLTRRGLFRASSAGVASVVIIGGVIERTATAAAAPLAAAPVPPRDLAARDPHAFAGLRSTAQAGTRALAVRVLPLDRAKFLAGARFDLRVEAVGIDPETARIEINVTGPNGPEPLLTGEPVRTSSAADSLEITYRGLSYARAGSFVVRATVSADGKQADASVTHEAVVANANGKRAKNVIFFLGDGMGQAPITAARILSRGITEGKYHSLLEMDRMEFRGLVTTSGADSIATDSANSMSAYMTGHKSSVNAMGVYESNAHDPNDHPRVETMSEILKRARGMAIGVVTTAEIQDATPAAVWSHTRRRSEYAAIMDQALNASQAPDVLMGGGNAALLPQSVEGSKRKDDRDLVAEFQAKGYAWASSRAELNAVMAGGPPQQLLALFHLGHMNFYMDREFHKNPSAPNPSQGIVAPQFNDQPTLPEMTRAALSILDKKPNGFFLMVEGASIDKAEHPLDWQRAAYDTIEFDQAIGVAKQWAANRDDTLIVVTADHNHAMSIAGTNDLGLGAGRSGNRVYAEAGFPNYVDANNDGFPDDPDPSRTLYVAFSNHPDFRDDFRFDQAGYVEPALLDKQAPGGPTAVPNPAKDADAELQVGNLPFNETNCVHTVEDVGISALGPGAAHYNGVLDNTEVFFGMMHALGIDPRG